MAFDDVSRNLANDNAFIDSMQEDLSFARLELTSLKAFDESKFEKEQR